MNILSPVFPPLPLLQILPFHIDSSYVSFSLPRPVNQLNQSMAFNVPFLQDQGNKQNPLQPSAIKEVTVLCAMILSLDLRLVCFACPTMDSECIAVIGNNLLGWDSGSYVHQRWSFLVERYILKMLEWNLSYPNPIHFLWRVSKADEYDIETRTIAKYSLEISCLEWRLLSAPPSLLATAAIWHVHLILDSETWVCLSMSFLMHPLLNSLSGRRLTRCITHHMPRVNYFLLWTSCSTMCSNLPSANHSIKNMQASNT